MAYAGYRVVAVCSYPCGDDLMRDELRRRADGTLYEFEPLTKRAVEWYGTIDEWCETWADDLVWRSGDGSADIIHFAPMAEVIKTRKGRHI